MLAKLSLIKAFLIKVLFFGQFQSVYDSTDFSPVKVSVDPALFLFAHADVCDVPHRGSGLPGVADSLLIAIPPNQAYRLRVNIKSAPFGVRC